ncbi:MAG: hypothetical protein JST32_14910 [Bacteroidetes bacterium]|nr:hypothetical protein [Bacteroidota bacterium]
MIQIGLVGEDPNDTTAIKNLLEKKYKDRIRFHILVRRIKGSQLDSAGVKRLLPIEFADRKCKFVIYVRDLDGFESQASKVKNKVQWFKNLDATVNGNGVLLLNIWEIEAFILGEINVFNQIYKTNCNFSGDPMRRANPKEMLKSLTSKTPKKYEESHCPEIFGMLDIAVSEKKLRFFSDFLTEFEDRLKSKSA